jgi:hypothetical protein
MWSLVRIGCSLAMGFLLQSGGIKIDSWRFWAILGVMLIYGIFYN